MWILGFVGSSLEKVYIKQNWMCDMKIKQIKHYFMCFICIHKTNDFKKNVSSYFLQVFLLSWFPKSQTLPCLTNDVDNPIAKLDLFGSEQSWYFLVFFGHIRLMMILSIIHKSQRKRYTTKSVVDQNNFPENMASNRLAVWSEKKNAQFMLHANNYTISLFHTIRLMK